MRHGVRSKDQNYRRKRERRLLVRSIRYVRRCVKSGYYGLRVVTIEENRDDPALVSMLAGEKIQRIEHIWALDYSTETGKLEFYRCGTSTWCDVPVAAEQAEAMQAEFLAKGITHWEDERRHVVFLRGRSPHTRRRNHRMIPWT